MSFNNLKDMYKSSESISQGDTVEKMIRGANQEWSLAPLHAFFSVVSPTQNKHLNRQIDFPMWLGQNSKYNKHLRYLQTMKIHSSRHISCDTYSFRLYDALLIFSNFIKELKEDNVNSVINQLIELDILKDDLTNLTEIILNGTKDFKEIKTKTKSELTRSYKKVKRNLPFIEDEVVSSDDQ
jgi:replication factor C subunit 1